MLDTALAEFNALRQAESAARPWAILLERLAQAAFRVAEHLVVYGSLAPGAPNHARLMGLPGSWERGWVEGELLEVGWGTALGFPALRWRPGAPRVDAHLLRSAALPERWTELDRFEGPGYRRILVPFYTEAGFRAVGNLYTASSAGSEAE